MTQETLLIKTLLHAFAHIAYSAHVADMLVQMPTNVHVEGVRAVVANGIWSCNHLSSTSNKTKDRTSQADLVEIERA